MKRISVLVVLVIGATFLTLQSLGKDPKQDPPDRYGKIMQLISRILTDGHYSPQAVDDAFSKRVFKRYIEELDPEKSILLLSDVAQLKEYEARIDDEMKGAPVTFFKKSAQVFNTRMEEAALIYKRILATPFSFTKKEEVQLNGDKLDYTASLRDREDRWRKKLKYMTLERYADALEQREKSKGKEGYTDKADSTLEREAREKVSVVMNRTFERYRLKFSDDDKFNLLVNIITTTMDPHTEFMPPVDKRYFDEEMSGQFYGIGATLQYDDGNIKITSIVTGSPAYKSGQLQVGDIIQKVAQVGEEPIDLTGFLVTDAVKVIRGKKDSEVKLTVRKMDGTVKAITLIREKIVQDEGYARSAVIHQEDGRKYGYIFLPEFYADFNDPNGPRCYIDVAKELEKLKKENVDGILFDLRGNGGGSLYDVVQMAGLFIPEGPIVQVKDREGQPTVLRDKDRSVKYEGPLIVLVNEFSASASEIFAAAMQDYGRALVIGSSSTYGKGTVQRNIGLDPRYGFSLSNAELGTIKLTLQKFYRINGGSTQLKGVSPDIVLPDNYEYLKVREKDTHESLPWDQIPKTSYTNWTSDYDFGTVRRIGTQRIATDTVFQLIREGAHWLAAQNEKTYSLQLDQYKKGQEQIRSHVRKLDSLQQGKQLLSVKPLRGEEGRWADDKPKQERFERWIKYLQKDIYLDQGAKIMQDILQQKALAVKTKGF